jgi:hypothetical protein
VSRMHRRPAPAMKWYFVRAKAKEGVDGSRPGGHACKRKAKPKPKRALPLRRGPLRRLVIIALIGGCGPAGATPGSTPSLTVHSERLAEMQSWADGERWIMDPYRIEFSTQLMDRGACMQTMFLGITARAMTVASLPPGSLSSRLPPAIDRDKSARIEKHAMAAALLAAS